MFDLVVEALGIEAEAESRTENNGAGPSSSAGDNWQGDSCFARFPSKVTDDGENDGGPPGNYQNFLHVLFVIREI